MSDIETGPQEPAEAPAAGDPAAAAQEPATAGDSGGETPSALDELIQAAMETWLGWLVDYPVAHSAIVVAVLLLIAWLAHLVVRRYVLRLIGMAMKRLPSWWAGVVAQHKVLHRLVPLVPTIIIARGIAFVPHLPAAATEFVQRIAQATVVLLTALAFGALLGAINDIYSRHPISHGRPIKGYLQVVKLIAYLAAGILIVAALMAESPWIFLSGLGAMMAIIMLIFRDTLLSLVAGIQLVNNDLVRVGDWIEMDLFNADGDVIDISLNVVKVRNWDKTITVIPTHKFLEHSFKNWRGMVEAGGRRIKRPVHIDMTSIRFLTAAEIERFSRFRLLREYMQRKAEELEACNGANTGDEECDAQIIANARHLTNVGTFRAYISEYLRRHSLVNHEMTTLVRQLDPGPQGLPIELFLYIKDTRWTVYEDAQSDIFDHILAIACEFGLRVFQEPTGHDLAALRAPRRPDSAAKPSKYNGKPAGAEAS